MILKGLGELLDLHGCLQKLGEPLLRFPLENEMEGFTHGGIDGIKKVISMCRGVKVVVGSKEFLEGSIDGALILSRWVYLGSHHKRGSLHFPYLPNKILSYHLYEVLLSTPQALKICKSIIWEDCTKGTSSLGDKWIHVMSSDCDGIDGSNIEIIVVGVGFLYCYI